MLCARRRPRECPHRGAVLGACLHTALMLILECRYLAKAFRKAGANMQGKPLSRRVIEDAGEHPLLPTSAGLVGILISGPFNLACAKFIPSGCQVNQQPRQCRAASATETVCFAGIC